MSSQNPTAAESTAAAPSPNTAAPNTAAPNTAAPKKNPRGLLLRLLGIVVLLAVIGWALWYFLDGRWYEGTDDAYVNGNVVQITPQVPGTVVSIGADDKDRKSVV